MTYTNHIILRGLDEARAHQRGESVGVLEATDRKRELARADPTDGEVAPRRRYHNLTPEQRIAIAMEVGKPEDVAKRNQIELSKVRLLRRMLREGRLVDTIGNVAEPTNERVTRGRKPTDPALIEKVAAEPGTAREVAKRLGYTMAFVYKCRGRNNGSL